MKVLSILLGVCFIFSVSQKSFACPCQEGKKADKAAAGTVVADAKDAAKDVKPDGTKTETGCACEKAGKACACSAHKKDGKAHKKGEKDCGCADKKEQA